MVDKNILSTLLGPRLKQDVQLSTFTTIKLGGNAKYFIEIENNEDLKNAIMSAKKARIPYFVLGGGTNVLIRDTGFNGLVIRNKTGKIKIVGFRGSYSQNKSNIKDIYIEADAGVLVNRLVRYCLDEGMGGLENFFQQPGTVGGAIYINAHNTKDNDYFGAHLFEAKIIDSNGMEKKVDKEYFHFGYDQSILQSTHETVLSVTLKLTKMDKSLLWEKAMKVGDYRHLTQPSGMPSMGCTFRNITKEEAFRLHTPNYTQSSGYLIEQVGLKGHRIGKAQISPKHANFILNEGGGKASDVLQLIALAKEKVKKKFGVNLLEEVVII